MQLRIGPTTFCAVVFDECLIFPVNIRTYFTLNNVLLNTWRNCKEYVTDLAKLLDKSGVIKKNYMDI